MILDVRTLVIISAVMPLGMGIMMAVYLAQRKVYPGFGRWVLSNFIFSLGFFSLSLRNNAPDFFTIILSNSLMVYSEVLVYEGIQLFFGRRAFSRFNYLILAGYILVQIYYTYTVPNINARIIWIGLVMFVLILRSGLALLNSTIPQLSKTTQPAAFIFFVTAATPFIRAIYTAFQDHQVDMMDDKMGAWASLVIVTAIIIWNFYFYFLTNARLEMELSQTHHEITQRANTDYLTQLFNRQYFMEHGAAEFERSRREGQPFSILFIDIDNLKNINDQFGHGAGDKAVKQVAKILQNEVRIYDLAARFGGDEFVMLLCNVDKLRAIQVAERIRAMAEQTPISSDQHTIYIRLSLGVADANPQDSQLDHVLQRADAALYQAKNDGRNRVSVSQ